MFIKPYQESQEYSNKYAQSFNKEKIEFKRNGKMVNMYDWIQEQNQDLEIYEVLEKGGTINSADMTNEQIYGNFKDAMSLRNICDKKVAVNNIFETLPINIRKLFNNDLSNFIENGEKFYADLIEEKRKAYEKMNKKEEGEGNVQK